MIAPPIPATPEELTVHLLNDHLTHSEKWQAGPTKSAELTPHGVDDGMSGAVYKAIVITGSGSKVDLIVKLRVPSGSSMPSRSHKTEVYFYRELAERAGVAAPETYIAEYDEQHQRMFIVQEFLSGSRIGVIGTYLSSTDVERVLSALVGMHAKWWNSPELDSLSNVRTGAQTMQSGIERFRSGQYDPPRVS